MSAAVKIREKISGLTSKKDTIIKEANRNLNDLNDSNNCQMGLILKHSVIDFYIIALVN